MLDLLVSALAKRAPLLTDDTNALRLIDGAGDGLPDLVLETYADHWLLASTTTISPQVGEWLRDHHHSCYGKRLDPHLKESPSHLCGPQVTAPFLIREHSLNYEISFQAGYSHGIFLDQRLNRAEVHRLMRPGLKLLNTFAYTGAFSVAAASAGAQTTTLDLSQTYLDWAKRNFIHNHLDPADHHFCKGDTFHWLRRFAKQGRKFDAIILDPPTFSRDDRGKVFRVEHHFGQLAALAANILTQDGWLLCCTNCRSISPREFESQLLDELPRPLRPHHARMPADFTDTPYLKSIWLQ